MKPFNGLSDLTLSGILEKLEMVPMEEKDAQLLYDIRKGIYTFFILLLFFFNFPLELPLCDYPNYNEL